MAGDEGNGARLGLREVLDLLRDDGAAAERRTQRLVDAMEGRVMEAISEVRGDLVRYEAVHGGEHVAQRTSSELAHQRFDAFIASSTLEAARRDGALGMTRLILDTFGRNWKAIAAAAAAILAATGGVRISIGV